MFWCQNCALDRVFPMETLALTESPVPAPSVQFQRFVVPIPLAGADRSRDRLADLVGLVGDAHAW